MDNFFNPQTLLSFFGILAAILVLGILVAVHELGHLLMAKMSRIRVDIFSVGMGKAIWSTKIGETAYQIGWIPFGGYCAFGEDNEELKADPRSIVNAPYWAKVLTIVGGSLFNMIFAFFVLTAVYRTGYLEHRFSNRVQVFPTIVQNGQKKPSPAWEAGLRSGDIITEVSGTPIGYFNEITLALLMDQTAQASVSYQRGGKTNTVPFTPLLDSASGIAILGVSPIQPAEIAAVDEDSPASLAGLRAGDIISKLNGLPMNDSHQIIFSDAKPAELLILRGNEPLNFTLHPRQNSEGLWEIGIQFAPPKTIPVTVKASNLMEGLSMARSEIKTQVRQIAVSLQKLFTGKIDAQKNLSGPVRIVSITGQIARTLDFTLLIRFSVMLSIALAVFNMLPIPGLDGGALVLNSARALFKRSPFAAAVEKIVSFIEYAGLILLIAVAAFVFVNDIFNISAERRAVKQAQQAQQAQPKP